MKHHPCCDFWADQYPDECTCGETAQRAPWFGRIAKQHAERSANESHFGNGNVAGQTAAQ